jgi:ribosome-binding factor A
MEKRIGEPITAHDLNFERLLISMERIDLSKDLGDAVLYVEEAQRRIQNGEVSEEEKLKLKEASKALLAEVQKLIIKSKQLQDRLHNLNYLLGIITGNIAG